VRYVEQLKQWNKFVPGRIEAFDMVLDDDGKCTFRCKTAAL